MDMMEKKVIKFIVLHPFSPFQYLYGEDVFLKEKEMFISS